MPNERVKKLGSVGKALENLPDAAQRASHKGREIAKLKAMPRQGCGDFDVEIRNFEAIEGGVQYEARAWKNGEAVGFGKDGSVEWERFRIFNSPILVERDGEYVEDLEACIIDGLAHTLNVKKEKFDSKRIVDGKVGHTTTTVYPDADVESTSMDGQVGPFNVTESWSTIHDRASGTIAPDDNTTASFINIQENGSQWTHFIRSAFLFDTSGIPDTDVISSATFSLYVTSVTDGHTDSMAVVSSAPASDTAMATGDYDSFGTTALATAKALSGLSTSAYNNYSLNASGLAAIDATGITKLGTRSEADRADSEPSKTSSTTDVTGRFADYAGTSQDPKLVVEHAAAASGPANVKTYMDIASANVKTIDDIAIASVKTWNDIA